MKFYWASGLLFSWNFPNRKFTLSTPNFNFTTSSFLIKKFPAHTSQAPTSFIHIKVKSSRYTKHNIRSHSHSDVHVLLMEGIESTLCLKHKSVYWFNDQVSRFLTSSRYRLSKTALFTRFKPFCFSAASDFFLHVHGFRFVGEHLTKQVTKSFYEGELRANDQINIFWIDEHEASTWHLSWKSMADGKMSKKLFSKINSAIFYQKKKEWMSKAFDFSKHELSFRSCRHVPAFNITSIIHDGS